MREALLEKTETSKERKEPTPEEMVNVAAHPEDFNGATWEETIGASEDRYLAIGCRRPPKKWSQGDGGSWQKCT
jgi:hypothetical protein